MKDLCKFLKGSLNANCKAFGIPQDQSKTTFDHDKIKIWADVEQHRGEIKEYLDLDVIALRGIYIKFSQIIIQNSMAG